MAEMAMIGATFSENALSMDKILADFFLMEWSERPIHIVV